MCSETVVGKWPIGGNGYEQVENILSALPPWFIEEDFSCSDEDLTILLPSMRKTFKSTRVAGEKSNYLKHWCF